MYHETSNNHLTQSFLRRIKTWSQTCSGEIRHTGGGALSLVHSIEVSLYSMDHNPVACITIRFLRNAILTHILDSSCLVTLCILEREPAFPVYTVWVLMESLLGPSGDQLFVFTQASPGLLRPVSAGAAVQCPQSTLLHILTWPGRADQGTRDSSRANVYSCCTFTMDEEIDVH